MSRFQNKRRRNSSSIGVIPVKDQCPGGHLFLLRLELRDVNRCKFNGTGEKVNLFTIGPGELPSLKLRSTTDRLRALFEQEEYSMSLLFAVSDSWLVRNENGIWKLSGSQATSPLWRYFKLSGTLSAAVAPQTRVATDFWVKTLNSFLVETKIILGMKTCTVEELNDSLKVFHFGLRKKPGGLFQAGSYASAQSIQRHLTSLKRTLNIRDEQPFTGRGFEEKQGGRKYKTVLFDVIWLSVAHRYLLKK